MTNPEEALPAAEGPGAAGAWQQQTPWKPSCVRWVGRKAHSEQVKALLPPSPARSPLPCTA